jgi:hypothetical protein
VRRWCAAGLTTLRAHQREIDELNVYPVPDGDTGTNLALTWAAGHEAVVTAEPGADPLAVLARGALLGARGNSGVIVSQLLRGLADALAGSPAGGKELAVALRAAADSAWAAVAEPVEGTVLSVASAAAAGAARAGADLVAVARAAAAAAAEALARTPQQLAVLAAAGVVDAGGRGLCLLLDALVEALTGVAAPDVPMAAAAHRPHEAEPAGHGYEVQYLLDAPAVDELKARLAALGDSLVVVGDPPTWNVHVHVPVDDVGAAIEAGIEAGRPYRISVARLPEPVRPQPTADRAAVVMAAGAGLTELFAAEGAAVLGGNPSTAEVLAAIRGTGSGRVVVLPNDPGRHAVAVAAAREATAAGIGVKVVPTRSPVQALAALAVRDPDRDFSDDVIAMAEAAGACRYGEVCVAVREAFTVAGRCRPGDVLGLVDGEVHVIGTDLARVCRALVDRMLGGGGELVTLVLGAGAPAGLDDELRAHVAEHWPFAEVTSYHGGQPLFPLLVGVE